MRKPFPLFLLVVVLPALALAGQRWIETNGQVPTTCAASDQGGDGLSLQNVEACRATVRMVDGGTTSGGLGPGINGGKLVPYYCEVGASSGAGWHEGLSTQVCTLETASKVDGGNQRMEQACEWKVSNRFGRVAVAAFGLVGPDAGFPFGVGADAGYNVSPVVRLECWGGVLGTPAGSTP